jgi:phage/plasmid-like protein (TIGR03299 family)
LGDAWHRRAGSDNHFPGAVPIERVEALFGWDAVSAPLFVGLPDGSGMPQVEGKQAVVRSDNGAVLGIFSDGYEIHQYREWLLTRVGNLIDDTVQIGSAGELRNGGQAWVSIEMPESITTPEGETFRPNLLACTSHDGSLATTFKRVVTRVVCDNTLAAGLGEEGQQVKIKHSRYSRLRIAEARDALAMIHTIAEDYAAECAALCRIDVSDKAWSAFLDAHTPLEVKGVEKVGRSRTVALNERERLTQMWRTDERVAPWKGTAWGVLQAVNTYAHHESTVRGMSRPERNMARAITGGVDELDRGTVATLTRVLANV